MLTTLTSEYLLLVLHYATDVARLGAQVIAGIGFIGAGTIIVTKQQRVKGLTTAAGLWAVAIAGLAIGLGLYEGAIITTLLIFCAERLFAGLELWLTRRSPEVNIMLEYTEGDALDALLQLCRSEKVKLLHLEITRAVQNDRRNACAIVSLRLHQKCSLEQFMKKALAVEGVTSLQEL